MSIHTPDVEDLEIVETEYVLYLFSNQSSVEMASNFFPKKSSYTCTENKVVWNVEFAEKENNSLGSRDIFQRFYLIHIRGRPCRLGSPTDDLLHRP